MSRHQKVNQMIKNKEYEDDDYQDDFDDDPYSDSNFSQAELQVISSLVQMFQGSFTRKKVIDVLYETEGNEERAYDQLFKLNEKNNKQVQTKKQTKKETKTTQAQNQQKHQQSQSSIQQQQQIPQQTAVTDKTLLQTKPDELQKQNSEESKVQKGRYQENFDLTRYNSEYPSIQYPNQELEHRDYVNLVVIGHVDSGKSTLIGKLLHSLHVVNDRDLHKSQKEAKRIGKESFFYAFVTDESQQEREKGVTMDVGYKMLRLNDKFLNLLDSPGHKDFVPHMITGACQADYAILVIDAAVNAFESGFQKGGQTKEHSYLIRSLGVSQLIVAINKMDTVNWSQDRFEFIKNQLSYFLTRVGFKLESLTFIPFSAFSGDNLNERSNLSAQNWYHGDSIFQAIDKFEKPMRSENKPMRMTISNCYTQHEGVMRGNCLFGKVDSGRIVKGEKYLIMPSGTQCTVKDIFVHDQKVKEAGTGSLVDIQIQLKYDYELVNLKSGDVLCSVDYPVPISNQFICEIVTLELDCPIIKGEQVVVHINGAKQPGFIKKLNKLLDKQGNLKKNFPRTIGPTECAEVEIETTSLIPLEIFKNSRSFGKVILRQNMNTIAIGKISQIKFNKDILKQTQTDKLKNEQQ